MHSLFTHSTADKGKEPKRARRRASKRARAQTRTRTTHCAKTSHAQSAAAQRPARYLLPSRPCLTAAADLLGRRPKDWPNRPYAARVCVCVAWTPRLACKEAGRTGYVACRVGRSQRLLPTHARARVPCFCSSCIAAAQHSAETGRRVDQCVPSTCFDASALLRLKPDGAAYAR